MASRILTIEISNELIKICEVSNASAKGVTMHKAITIPTPEGCMDDGVIRNGGSLAETIKLALKDNLMLSAKDVIMTVLSTKIASKEAVLPSVGKGKLADLVKANAAEYFPVNNIDEYVITHTVLETIEEEGTKNKNLRILAMAAPSLMIEGYYDLAKQLGLNLIAVDYLGNSTLQILKHQIDEAPSIVIQVGNESTIINVMRNKVLQFQRTVPYGRSAVVNAVMESKKLSYAVALEILATGRVIHDTFDGDEITESLRYLVNSISRIVDYYIARNQDKPIEKAYIMGDGASMQGIESLFTNELNIEFAKLDTLQGVECDKLFRITRNEQIQYMSTLGAAMAPVNFVPLSVEKTVARKGNTKIFVGLLAAAIVAATLIVAIPAVQYITKKDEKEDLAQKVKQVERSEQILKDLNLSKNKLSDAKKYYKHTVGANDQLYNFICDLEQVLPKEMVVGSFNSVNGSVTMSGQCAGKEIFAKTLMELKKLDYVKNVYSGSGSESLNADENVVVSFTITLQISLPEEKTEESAK